MEQLITQYITDLKNKHTCTKIILGLVLSETSMKDLVNDKIFEYDGTVLERIIKTKIPLHSSKRFVLNNEEITNFYGVPLITQKKVMGVLGFINPIQVPIENIENIHYLSLYISEQYYRTRYEVLRVDDKLLRTKDFFLANMSHEIRTPLNGIIGYIQLLMQTKITEVQKDYLLSVNKCSLSLLSMINNILDYGKLTSGKMKVNITSCKITDTINSVIDTLKTNINEKEHKIDIIIDKIIPMYILIDKQKVIQILINLVSNAIKYTNPKGDIKINITLEQRTKKMIKFIISDNGRGMMEDDIRSLFTSFSSKEGCGLGLMITKKLIELMNGNIDVQSEPDVGSTFTVILPFNESKNDYDTNPFRERKILLFLSSVSDRITILAVFNKWRISCTMCSVYEEVDYLIKTSPFDLCIIDNEQSAKRIKEDINTLFPILFYGSNNSSYIDGCISAPLNIDNLYESLTTLFKNSKYVKKDSLRRNLSIKILVIEDIVYNQKLIVDMLASLKYMTVDTANNGVHALELISKKKYDLLLLDLKMPGMDGFTFLEKVDPMYHDKIIVITASVVEQDKQKCYELGCKHYLTKPVDLRELRDLLTVMYPII